MKYIYFLFFYISLRILVVYLFKLELEKVYHNYWVLDLYKYFFHKKSYLMCLFLYTLYENIENY